MKNYFVVLLLIFISCKEVNNSSDGKGKQVNLPNKIVATDTLIQTKGFKIDTLIFEKLRERKLLDKVLAVQLEKVFSKDSVQLTKCRLDFYLKSKLIHSVPVTLYASSEDPIWSVYEEIFVIKKTKKFDNRFFEISYGVPACGFTQSNFLFFIENNSLQLVAQYDSMGDGVYSDWVDFEPYYSKDKIVSFSSKRVQIDSDESKTYNEENEDLIRTFSDSTVYKFNAGKWSSELKTPKGKPYKKEFKTFNELYKQE